MRAVHAGSQLSPLSNRNQPLAVSSSSMGHEQHAHIPGKAVAAATSTPMTTRAGPTTQTSAPEANRQKPVSTCDAASQAELVCTVTGDGEPPSNVPASQPTNEVRPDENKENIAPIRHITPTVLVEEAQTYQANEAIAMRTRRRMAHAQHARPMTPIPTTPRKRRILSPPTSSSTSPSSSAQAHTPSRKRTKTEYESESIRDAPPTPVQPTPPATPTRMPNAYAQARALLRTEVLVGRDMERARLHAFLDASLSSSDAHPCEQVSGCLHISGMPGTGKTALVRDVLRERTDATHIYINCIGIAHPQEAAQRIAAALDVPDLTAVGRAPAQSRPLIVVLDEMDHWLHVYAHQDMLQRIFCLPKQLAGKAHMALVGIANSLDLTERFVPVVRSKGVKPDVLHFAPMQADQVLALLEARLADMPGLFGRAALQLLARKLTASSGDIRRALDTCRQALDLAENEFFHQQQQRQLDSQPASTTQPTPVSVTPTHILRVLAHMAGHAQSARVRSLGVHAKLLLLTWVVLQEHAEAGLFKSGGTTRGDGGVCLSDLEAAYARMLEQDAAFVTPLGGSELLDVLERLEVQGLVRIWSDVGGGSMQQTFARSSSASRTASSSSNGSSSSAGHACGSGSSHAAKRFSPSGKRAAARQMLSTNRRMAPTLERECIVRALTTGAVTGAESTHTPTVVDAMSRLLQRAELDIARQTKWRSEGEERERTRREELGGGRRAIAGMP